MKAFGKFVRLLSVCALLSVTVSTSTEANEALVAPENQNLQFEAGQQLFVSNCVVCHRVGGIGQTGLAPPLTGNPARYMESIEGRKQIIWTILFGMYGDITVDGRHYNFKMPAFSQLSDTDLALVLNYVAFKIAQAPQSTDKLDAKDVAAERTHVPDSDLLRKHRSAVLDADSTVP
jgi:mono/diheme cytochrome c family protein